MAIVVVKIVLEIESVYIVCFVRNW